MVTMSFVFCCEPSYKVCRKSCYSPQSYSSVQYSLLFIINTLKLLVSVHAYVCSGCDVHNLWPQISTPSALYQGEWLYSPVSENPAEL